MAKTFKGAGIVWHQGQMAARFVDGTYTTDDEATIKLLEQMGYWCLADDEQTARANGEANREAATQKSSRSKKAISTLEPDTTAQGLEG